MFPRCAVLILDSVTTNQKVFSDEFTLTVKGDCVFKSQVNFLGETQLQGGTFRLSTDGDLFKATVYFPLAPEPEPQPQVPETR